MEINDKENKTNYHESKKPKIPLAARKFLRDWYSINFSNPYPTDGQKQVMAHRTGLKIVQINNWLINARRRISKCSDCDRIFSSRALLAGHLLIGHNENVPKGTPQEINKNQNSLSEREAKSIESNQSVHEINETK